MKIRHFNRLLREDSGLFLDVTDEIIKSAAEITVEKWAKASEVTVEEFVKKLRQRRRLKRKAKKIGLHYWPALFPIYKNGKRVFSDPEIFAVAERILKRKYKYPWRTQFNQWSDYSNGGWDSKGRRGLSNEQVTEMWVKCGRKINGKFAYQVHSGEIAKAGESLTEFKNYVRGNAWLKERRFGKLIFCRKAVAVLGKLSPELRTAAILSLFEKHKNNRWIRSYIVGEREIQGPLENVPNPIRIRDLDWDSVRERQNLLKNAGKNKLRIQLAVGGIGRARQLLNLGNCFEVDSYLAPIICPSYPKIPFLSARALCLGKSPVELSEGILTKKEAHEWLLSGAKESPIRFLERQLEDKFRERLHHPLHLSLRSVKIIRWIENLFNTNRTEVLFKERLTNPDGVYFTYYAVIDEIQDEDILTGKDSVHDVFERVQQRKIEVEKQRLLENSKPLREFPNWVKFLPKWIKYLNTAVELFKEGDDLLHCVGGYSSAVRSGQSHILSIRTTHGWSTAELLCDGGILQHKGKNNMAPPKRNDDLLLTWLNKYKSKIKANKATIRYFGEDPPYEWDDIRRA